MISMHEAHKLLVRNHYKVWMMSPYDCPVVIGAKAKDVAEFLWSQGYEGRFIVINEGRKKKGGEKAVDRRVQENDN